MERYANRFVGPDSEKVRVNPADEVKISRLRAQSVVNYQAGLGIPRSRLSAEAFGSTNRVVYGTTLDGQQKTRRVNFINYAKLQRKRAWSLLTKPFLRCACQD